MRTTLSLGTLAALLAIVPGLGACGAGNGDEASSSDDTALQAAAAACAFKVTIASVSASGADAPTPASQAIDGDLTTRWANNGVGSSITADLGASKSVCGVSVAWYQGTTRTANFSVGVSNDGATFTHVLDGTSNGTTDALQQATFGAVNARYVRVTVNGNSVNDWASIDELAVDAPTATGFAHPGILVTRSQLDNVKAKIAAGEQPWKRAYDEMVASKYLRSTYEPAPRATISCPSDTGPDLGCAQEIDDGHAAYANALVWAYTGNTAAADKAIHILNLYAATVKEHTGSNVTLRTGWGAPQFLRAAEIVRHTSTRWAAADVATFQSFMRAQYLPHVKDGWPFGNGNWDAGAIAATMEIAVFSDDRATFDAAVALWKARVPAYVYVPSDGALPIAPTRGTSQYNTEPALLALWEWPTTSGGTKPAFPFPNGVAQESCRDFNHVSLGLTALMDAAETAHIQGVDLYSFADTKARFTSTIEFHSKYLNGATLPSSLCGGEAAHRGSGSNPSVGFLSKAPESVALNYAVAYNHYANRLGVNLPETRAALATIDANGSAYRNKVGPTASWENLTNIER